MTAFSRFSRRRKRIYSASTGDAAQAVAHQFGMDEATVRAALDLMKS
jgi:hypothetical protein